LVTSIIIGRNISKYRVAYGYTLDNLATFLGIECQQLSNCENGISNISVINLNKIADLLGVELDELLAKNTRSILAKTHSQPLTDIDIQSIAEFNRIVLNYIKMNRLMGSL